MYEVMSGDTLSWKVPSPRQSEVEPDPELHFTGDGGATKILKVCFCTSNTLGKNFKLVKCDSSWQIRVRTRDRKSEELGPVRLLGFANNADHVLNVGKLFPGNNPLDPDQRSPGTQH